MSKCDESNLRAALGFFGLSLVDLSSNPYYQDRKGQIWGVKNLDGKVLCAYSTLAQIKKWAHRKLSN